MAYAHALARHVVRPLKWSKVPCVTCMCKAERPKRLTVMTAESGINATAAEAFVTLVYECEAGALHGDMWTSCHAAFLNDRWSCRTFRRRSWACMHVSTEGNVCCLLMPSGLSIFATCGTMSILGLRPVNHYGNPLHQMCASSLTVLSALMKSTLVFAY